MLSWWHRDVVAAGKLPLMLCFVAPAGQVTVPAAWPAAKSSMVCPSGTAGRGGPGLTTARRPAAASAARSSPVP